MRGKNLFAKEEEQTGRERSQPHRTCRAVEGRDPNGSTAKDTGLKTTNSTVSNGQRVVGIGHATGASGAEDIRSAAESVQRRAKFSNLEIKGDKMFLKRSIIKMTNDS